MCVHVRVCMSVCVLLRFLGSHHGCTVWLYSLALGILFILSGFQICHLHNEQVGLDKL